MSEIHLLPADSISVHSRSLLGWLIRKAETRPKEGKAYAYKAIQVDFGCEPNAADPDVIQDYKKARPESWKLIVKAERGVMIVNES